MNIIVKTKAYQYHRTNREYLLFVQYFEMSVLKKIYPVSVGFSAAKGGKVVSKMRR